MEYHPTLGGIVNEGGLKRSTALSEAVVKRDLEGHPPACPTFERTTDFVAVERSPSAKVNSPLSNPETRNQKTVHNPTERGHGSPNFSMDPAATLARFRRLGYRRDPENSPVGQYLRERGHSFETVALEEGLAEPDVLGLRFVWKRLLMTVRQPTEEDILICRIDRSPERHGLGPVLFDLVDFFCTIITPTTSVRYLGGAVRKVTEVAPGDLPAENLAEFYRRVIGGIVEIESGGLLWMFGDSLAPERYQQSMLWRRAAFRSAGEIERRLALRL